MKKFTLPLLIALMFLLGACDNSDLLDPYFVEEARILAVKIEDPRSHAGRYRKHENAGRRQSG